MIPVPEITIHIPVPTAGVLAANEEEEEQIVWSGPASAVVGSGSLKIVTWSTDAGQVPLEIVHWKIFEPELIPVIEVVADPGETITPVPENKVHTPLPVTGMFALSEDEVAQIVWSGPAFAGEGLSSTVMLTWSEVEGQTPLEMVH